MIWYKQEQGISAPGDSTDHTIIFIKRSDFYEIEN